jgi:hypothetical protein
MSGPKILLLQSHSKTMGFITYDHITSRRVLSSNSLDSYYCRRSRYTVDSFSNFFCSVEHKLSTYPQESDLLSQSVHRSADDKQNISSNGYPWSRATIPRTSK